MSIISLIDKIPFGNSAEKGFFLYSKLSHGFLRKMEEDNFRKTVSFAYEHSKFYKRKFDELGIRPERIKKPEDLGSFFTTAEDIRANVGEFVCQKADTAFETTGTTSKRSKRVYFSRQEIKEAAWAGAVGLWGLGVRPEDRVVSAFDYSLWVSGPVLQASCEVLGCFHVEVGRMAPEEFFERLADYGITVIVSDPSWILAITEIMKKNGSKPWPVKLILGGGENMSEDMRRYVEGVWKTDMILSYGQTEAFGAIGMESRDKSGYHLNEFHNYFEIIDPDPDGYGELVYTTLNRRVMPLIRYKSADVTRFLEGNSKNGLPGRRIDKLKGRVDEWRATAMGNLAPWIFEPILGGIEGISGDWQIVILKDGNKDLIEFHVEALNGGSGFEEKILDAVKASMPDAWKYYEMDFFKLGVKVSSKGSLRTGRKLSRLVDKRDFS